MKASKYPRFRSVTRRGKGGQVWVYYRYDMRGTGKPDINLGSDYASAIAQWDKLHNHLPLSVARVVKLVDAGDSKSPSERSAGSIPAPGTNVF